MAEPGPGARQFAELFHDRYERLAPSFGYVTREETRAFDPTSTNGRLMIAVCDEILNWFDRNDVGLCARCAAELHAHETKPAPPGVMDVLKLQARTGAALEKLHTCANGFHEFDENTWFCKHCGELQAPL